MDNYPNMVDLLFPPEIAARVHACVQRCKVPAVCLLLAGITFAVFGQTAGFGFVNYDDNKYVYENPVVERGLTLKGAVWALTYGEIGHWHPLTWLSHMADCQAYGLWAGGHHLTNVALHAVAVVLLFLALREMTGNLWRSAFVAAVFAIHPLRVESVAWIAERKDVLSGVFFMLTLWAYGRYARQPSRGRYAAVALWFGLGLLCKNMLVTLPFVLLLLDWWPLHRVTLDRADGGKLVAPFWRLVREKIPLFLLSAGSCVATFLVPEKVLDTQRVPFLERIGNAVVSYGVYLWQMVFPLGLAIPYVNPPNGQPLWKVGLAFVLLAAISISVLAQRKGRPYLLVGWLWYLGMLVPAIGFVQISYYAHADRYTYLPGIGLVLAATWAVGDWSFLWQHRRAGLGGLMAAVIGTLMVCAWIQTGFWKGNETLWNHTLDCTTGNYVAYNNFGDALRQEGKMDDAITHYEESLQIAPWYAEAHNNLGLALFQKGSVDQAMAHLQKAAQIAPHDAAAQNNLGYTLLQMGRADEAITHCQQALQMKPDFAEAHNNLGNALGQKGRVDDAISQFQQALQINPFLVEAHNNFGNALLQKGRVDDAIAHFQQAVQINPTFVEAHNNLGVALGREGRVEEAIACYQKALEIKPDYAAARNNLGSAFIRQGRMDEAISQYQKALEIKPQFAEAHMNLANGFSQLGRMDEAITHYQKALEIKPHFAEAQNKLAWLLATCPQASLRHGDKAVELALQANALAGGENPAILHTLAAAFAEAGRFPEAAETAQHALHLAEAQSNSKLAGQLRVQLKLYQAGSPFHSLEQAH
jgi:tetratricopeptide (TPR) repeat protein